MFDFIRECNLSHHKKSRKLLLSFLCTNLYGRNSMQTECIVNRKLKDKKIKIIESILSNVVISSNLIVISWITNYLSVNELFYFSFIQFLNGVEKIKELKRIPRRWCHQFIFCVVWNFHEGILICCVWSKENINWKVKGLLHFVHYYKLLMAL